MDIKIQGLILIVIKKLLLSNQTIQILIKHFNLIIHLIKILHKNKFIKDVQYKI